MKKLFVTLLLATLLFPSISFADFSCVNNTHMQFSTTINVNSQAVAVDYIERCPFNCKNETGQCNPSPYEIGIMDIGIMYGIFAISVLFFVLSWKTGTDAYRIYYFFAGLIFLLATLLMMITYIDLMNKSASIGYVEDMLWWILVVYIFSIVILFIMMFVDLWKLLSEKKVFERLGI